MSASEWVGEVRTSKEMTEEWIGEVDVADRVALGENVVVRSYHVADAGATKTGVAVPGFSTRADAVQAVKAAVRRADDEDDIVYSPPASRGANVLILEESKRGRAGHHGATERRTQRSGAARRTKRGNMAKFRHLHYYGSTYTGNASPRSNFNLTAHFDEDTTHNSAREARAAEFLQEVKQRHIMSPRLASAGASAMVSPRKLASVAPRVNSYNSGRQSPRRPQWGMKIHDTGDGGVTVLAVKPGSPAQRAGLRRGDRILELSGRVVSSLRDAADQLATPKASVTINYLRNHREYQTTMWA